MSTIVNGTRHGGLFSSDDAQGLHGLENQFEAVQGVEGSYGLPTSKIFVIHSALAGLFAWSPFIWQTEPIA